MSEFTSDWISPAWCIRICHNQRVKIIWIGFISDFGLFFNINRSNFISQINDFFSFDIFHIQSFFWRVGNYVRNYFIWSECLKKIASITTKKFTNNNLNIRYLLFVFTVNCLLNSCTIYSPVELDFLALQPSRLHQLRAKTTVFQYPYYRIRFI